MNIQLSLIRPSPNPIRKTWDEDKMNELAASIKERGVIVPIKVRPVLFWCDICEEGFSEPGLRHCPKCAHHYDDTECHNCHRDNSGVPVMEMMATEYVLGNGDLVLQPFEIVYGHRRVEAARRAGLTEIPAIVEGVDDWTALLQQIIENEVREDVFVDERASGYKVALNHPMNPKPGNINYLATSTGVPRSRISESLTYLEQIEEGVVGSNNPAGDASIRQVLELKMALGDDTDSKRVIYEKHRAEELNWRETRAVAEAYKAAPTPELKDAVLNTSGKLGDADHILQVARMKVSVNNMTERHEVERRQAYEEYDRAVKDFFDFMKATERVIKTAQGSAQYGKFSPEGARVAIGRIDRLIGELNALKGALESVR